MIRDEVRRFVGLGPLPSELDESLTEEQVDHYYDVLNQIVPSVTDEEARYLLRSFGDDECFGLAWKLLHLIETAAHIPIDEAPSDDANEWVRRIWSSAQRAKALGANQTHT